MTTPTTPPLSVLSDLDARVAEIEARRNAATGGPWTDQGEYRGKEPSRVIGNLDGDCDDGVWRQLYTEVCDIADNEDHDANAAFIINSHADVGYLLSVIAAMRGALEWQPIETAPKDGTAVLCWAPDWSDSEPALCYFDSTDDRLAGPHWAMNASGCWPDSQPTHWYPYAAPPERGAKES